MTVNDRLVWIDCEMTGLDIERDALIEIACLVTDAELNVLDEGVDVIIKPPAEAVASMVEVVREMHTTSGLLAELPSGITVAEAQDIVLGYVRGHVAEPKRVPLCGNSIATDRWFIARDMPELDGYLHYRMVDVSSIKELAATSALALPLTEASVKIRSGSPSDEPEDYELDVWAGVVPVTTGFGEPEADAGLRPGISTPAHIVKRGD